MRSLSPGPMWYSASSGAGACAAGFLSGSLSTACAIDVVQKAAVRPAARYETSVMCFIAFPSVLIGGRTEATAPVHDRPRQRLLLQRIGVDGVRRVAGGANRNPQGRRELVVLDARHQPIDDARR